MKKIVTALLCSLLCTSCIQFPHNPAGPAYCNKVPLPPPGLISWWPFETTSGDPHMWNTFDTPDVISGMTAVNMMNDTSPFASQPYLVSGHVGHGAHFQRDGLASIATAFFGDPLGKMHFGTASGFTIDAWVKPGCGGSGLAGNAEARTTAVPTNPAHPCTALPAVILQKMSPTAGFSFYLDATGHLTLDMKGPVGTAHFVTQAAIAPGAGWTFVSISVPRKPTGVNANQVLVWMNGLVPLDTVHGDTQLRDTSALDISNNDSGNIGGGDIMVDEVEVFGRALQFWETGDIYTRGKCPPPAGNVWNGSTVTHDEKN